MYHHYYYTMYSRAVSIEHLSISTWYVVFTNNGHIALVLELPVSH